MTQILGVKFTDYGQIYYFSSGPYVVEKGQSVIVRTDQGLGLGRVVSVAPFEARPEGQAAPAPAPEAAPETASEAVDEEAVPEPVPEAELPTAGEIELDAVREFQAELGAGEAAEPAEAPAETPAEAQPADAGGPRPAGRAEHKPIYRLANDKDLDASRENEKLAGEAFEFCRQAIQRLGLEMKLVDVEVNFDRGKMIFYFTAPGRVDFRELIKDLVREYHTRIELRQIGVRHETQMLGAIGNCGQICCCRRFLRKFVPVTIRMAKEQNLFLNPAKISGICGRLLCCLSYEQQGYEEFHKQCPRIGKRFTTALGQAKVLRSNFFRKTLTLLVEGAGEREVGLEEWREIVNKPPAEPAPGQPPQRPERRERPSRGRPPPPPEGVQPPEPAPGEAGEPPPAESAPPPAEDQPLSEAAPAAPERPGEAKPRQKHKRRRRKGRQRHDESKPGEPAGPKE